MEHLNSSHKLHIRQVIARYEAMSQKGTVSLLEETVFLGMIDYCISEEKLTKALRIVNDAIPQHPFSVDLYLHKAHLLLNQHNIAESLVTVNQVKLFAPLTVEVELLHAELLGLNGKNHEALDMLSEIKPLTSREVRSKVYLLEAQLFENLGQYSKMFDAASRCLALNDANIEGYERMIWATEYSQRFAESVKFHNRLLDRDAYNWRAWLNLGFAQEALDNNNEAIEAFEYAIAIDDKCRAAYMEAGELLLHIGNYTRAQYIFEMAIFNTGEDSVVLQKLGFCYEKTDNVHTAMQFYNRALECNPNDASAYFRLGECYRRLGKWQKAIDVYLRAVALNGRNEKFHAALADAYWQMEQYGKALSSFRKAAFTAPDDLKYWLLYAGFLFSVGQEKKALHVLQDAQNYTFGAEIEYCQIACLISLGRRGEALYRLSEALAEDFDKHTTLLSWRPDLAQSADFQNLIKDYKR